MINRFNYDEIKKTYYNSFNELERKYEKALDPTCYYIIRFDGKGMTKRFKSKEQFLDLGFLKVIETTFYSFCQNHNQQILFAYHCNDEISILIKAIKQDKNNLYNRMEKLLSLFASEISVLFDRNYRNRVQSNKNNEYNDVLNVFDARLFQVPKKKIDLYFCTRQAFCIEHIFTRIKNYYGTTANNDEDIMQILEKHEDDPQELYYGHLFAHGSPQASFDFEKEKERLEKMLFDRN